MTNTSGSANRQAAAAESDALSAQRHVKELEDRVDKLTLVCAAVWDLLRDRGKLTEADLIERIAILDAKDGVADGKMSRKTRPCSNCKRPVSPRTNKCMYCNTLQTPDSVFEGI
jgi:hypothetical protein